MEGVPVYQWIDCWLKISVPCCGCFFQRRRHMFTSRPHLVFKALSDIIILSFCSVLLSTPSSSSPLEPSCAHLFCVIAGDKWSAQKAALCCGGRQRVGELAMCFPCLPIASVAVKVSCCARFEVPGIIERALAFTHN